MRRAKGPIAVALAAATGLAVAAVVLLAGSSQPLHPAGPTVQSVPWRLLRKSGRQVTVGWVSGTCDPSLRPRPAIKVVETNTTVTLAVLIHVVKAGRNLCAGVGLGGTISTALAHRIGDRKLLHGTVTDHD